MNKVNLTINGIRVEGTEGMTILEAANGAGVDIPTFCHHQDLSESGSCRVCVVEVEGYNTLVGSCHTPIAEGMVIHTHSPRVLAVRRGIVELLLSGHTGACVTDDNAHSCELHNLASDLEVGPPRFSIKRPRFYPVEERNPYVNREMSKCVLCYRCIRACREIAKQNILSMAYRGFHSKVVADYDEPLNCEECKDCGICIDYCPTAALSRPGS